MFGKGLTKQFLISVYFFFLQEDFQDKGVLKIDVDLPVTFVHVKLILAENLPEITVTLRYDLCKTTPDSVEIELGTMMIMYFEFVGAKMVNFLPNLKMLDFSELTHYHTVPYFDALKIYSRG